jgi:amino acid adenylation domain-containing protein
VAFGLHRGHLINPDFPGIEAEEIFVDRESVPFDLNVSVVPHPQGFLVEIEYSTDLFDADRITRMFGHFKTLLEGIVENPQKQISQLPLLTETEWQGIVLERNDTAVDYPKSQTIHELFEKQALETPNATAITFEDRHITYRDLNILSDRLARILSNEGVIPEEIVGIHLERSIEMIVGLLAILKAGAAYLPLDPSMPRERLAFLASDAGIKKVLIHPSTQRTGEMLPARMIPIDLESLQQVRTESAPLKSAATAGQMCYVLYTSGSTGRPKGVCVPHRAVVHLVKGCNYVDLDPAEVLLQYAPLSFDASTFEIWGALLNGARLVIAPPGVRTLTELGGIIRDNGITTLWLTSVLFNEMVDQRIDDLAGVRQLLAGGDVFSVSHARKAMSHLKNCRVTNCYGPTECTTFTLYHHIREIGDLATSIPIGRPISNTRVYILDESLQPTPIGVPGEIYIGGDGLALGYLNQPELTAEKFVHDPYSSQDGSFLYRTGDVGYWNDQGSVEFVGRTDDQIKIRGFRIEPAEIESALSRHPSIAQSLVLPYQSPDAAKQLIAYVVATEQLSQNDVRNFLEKQLPSYMLPVFTFFLSELPLNANGKVDRSALPLPLPLPDSSPLGNSQGARSGPENYLESQLIRIWQKVLKRKSIGVHDNFFDLGGHSLLALKLFAEIEKETGKTLPLMALLTTQTIRSLSRVILQDGYDRAWSSLVPIQPKGSKPPFFLCHGIGGNVLNYRFLGKYFGEEQPLYGLQSQGLDGKVQPLHRIEDMVAHYIREIQTIQPKETYFLVE